MAFQDSMVSNFYAYNLDMPCDIIHGTDIIHGRARHTDTEAALCLTGATAED